MSMWNFPKTKRTAIEEELTITGLQRDKFLSPIVYHTPFRTRNQKKDHTGYVVKVLVILGIIFSVGIISNKGKRI